MGTVVAVLAHPDDETFICGGTLAKAAAAGHRVVLVCATKGEMGRRLGVPPTATRETLPDLREQEMRAACAALGVHEVQWLGVRDKTLEIQPPDALVTRILNVFSAERPDVVLTFHERLGGHPDHCTIGMIATRAWRTYVAQQPQTRLFYVAWSTMAEHPDQYGLRAEQVLDIDVSAYLLPKLRAYRAHRTQSGLNRSVWKHDAQACSSLPSREYFLQPEPPWPTDHQSLWS